MWNVVRGTSDPDNLVGGDGNDYVLGLGGADTVQTGAGNDIIYVSTAFASVLGGSGIDRLYLNGADARTIDLAAVDIEYVFGADGGDTFNAAGQTAPVTMFGNGGDDALTGSSYNDILYGGSGTDTFDCGAGHDRVYTNTEFALVQGGDGFDFLFLNGFTPLTLNLAAISFESVISGHSNDVIDATGLWRGAQVESGWGNDTLVGSNYRDQLNGGFDNDTIDGGSNADTLTGGAGMDVVTGGGGADRFVFADNQFAGSSADLADRITDFRRAQGDLIDLSAVDAISGTWEDDSFTFIGSAAFHKVAGELRFGRSDGNTFVEGDFDGDGGADFTIFLIGPLTLMQTDFVL